MRAVIYGLTPMAIALRLAVLVVATSGIDTAVSKLGETMSPMSKGFIAIPTDWKLWSLKAPRDPPEGPEIPLPCPYRLSQERAIRSYQDPTFDGPTLIFALNNFILVREPHVISGPATIDGPWFAGRGANSLEQFCTYALEDGSFLVASTWGSYFRLDADFVRLDGASAWERICGLVAKHPAKSIFALALLALGGWLVFRRRRVTWLSLAGCILAAGWLTPVGELVQRLNWG